MTTNNYIPPMTKVRRIIFIAYDGAELLDVVGPAAVFTTANYLEEKLFYEVIVVANGGATINSSGLSLNAKTLETIEFTDRDTVLVAGSYGADLRKAMQDPSILAALCSASKKSERFGSICTGAFLLAAAGLIEGKRVATHWAGGEQLANTFKNVDVDGDALYLNDGDLWTSAGVTTGIDMALAILEQDQGSQLKSRVARQLVVYAHRPGNQSQFSEILAAQVKADENYAGLIDWLNSRLAEPTKVADMASQLGMSERTFYRKFIEIFDKSPSKFLEHLRLDASKALIEAGEPIKCVAPRVGFKSESAFRSSFKKHFGVTPTLHREMQGQWDELTYLP